MCVVYRDQHSLPSTRGELLRILTRQSYERERDKGRHCNLGYDEMLAGLGQLALRAVQDRSATAIEEAEAARRIANYEPLRTLGVNMNLLRRTKSDRYIQFAHQLVLEYFAAERLVAEPRRLEKILRKPKFALGGGRRAQRSDEVCMTFAELSADPAEALLAISRIDPFVAVDTLAQSERMNAVDPTTRVQLARDLLRIHEADGDTVIVRLRALGDAAIVPLNELLTHTGNKPARRFAVKAIAAIESLGSIEKLFAVIHDSDRWMRRDASAEIRRLAERRPELATAFLTERLSQYGTTDQDELVRLLSPRQEMPQREEPSSAAAFELTVHEAIDTVLRVETLVVDGISVDGEVPRFDLKGEVRRRFRLRVQGEEEREAQWAWAANRYYDDPLKLPLFAKFARNSNTNIRSFGILGLFNCGETGRELALQLFSSCPPNMRLSIICGLTFSGGRVDPPTLARLLDDHSSDVRQVAMQRLLHFDPMRGLDELQMLLHNHEYKQRLFALRYLSSLFAEISRHAGLVSHRPLLLEQEVPRLRERIERDRLDLGKDLVVLLRSAAPTSEVREKAALSLFLLFEEHKDLLYATLDATPHPGTQKAK